MYAVVEVVREIRRNVPDLPQKLKAARVADGRSVQLLATLSGISYAYWYQLETKKRKTVSETVIRSIEKVLGVDLGLPSFDVPQIDEIDEAPPPKQKSSKGKKRGTGND